MIAIIVLSILLGMCVLNALLYGVFVGVGNKSFKVGLGFFLMLSLPFGFVVLIFLAYLIERDD